MGGGSIVKMDAMVKSIVSVITNQYTDEYLSELDDRIIIHGDTLISALLHLNGYSTSEWEQLSEKASNIFKPNPVFDHQWKEFYNQTDYKNYLNYKNMKNNREHFDKYLETIQSELSHPEKMDINHILNEILNLNVYNNDFISVNEGDIVMDIGVNFGLFSLDALQYNPKKIIGFEPNPRLIQYFSKLNLPNVELYQAAVSNKNGKITFYENSFPGRSSLHAEKSPDTIKSSYEVEVYNINDVLKSHNKINYLKVDCEGAEYEIFEAMNMDILSKNIDKIAIEFHNIPTDLKVVNLISKIQSAGFETKLDYVEGSGDTGMLYARKQYKID
jgi:FkbM family methyltransferase